MSETEQSWGTIDLNDDNENDTRSLMTSGGTVFPVIFNFLFSNKMAGGGYQDFNNKINLNIEFDEINNIDEELDWMVDNDKIKDIVVKNFDKYPIKDDQEVWNEILQTKLNFDSITEKQINNKYNSIQPIRFKIPHRYEISIPNDKSKFGSEFGNNITRTHSRVENLVYGGYNNNKKYIYLTEDSKHKSRKIYTEKNGDKYFKKEKRKMYLKDFKGKYRYIQTN